MIKRILATLLFLLLAPSAWGAAPTYDASTTATGVQSGTSISVVHTVGGGCLSPILLAAVGQSTPTPETPTSVTTTAGAMTLVDNILDIGSTTHRIDVYRYIGASGSQTVTANFSGTINYLVLGVSSYCGVHQTAALGTPAKANSFGSAVTVDVTSATDELVVDFVLIRNDGGGFTYTPDASQTQRFQTGSVALDQLLTASDEAGAATVTMSGTLSGNTYWGIVGVSLKPAAAASVTPAALAPMVFQ